MQRYQIVVNGNTYTVTVKSLVGNNATVDVDGWEFQVRIVNGDGALDFKPVVVTAAGSGSETRSTAVPDRQKIQPPSDTAGKRTSALEHLSPKKSSAPKTTRSGEITAHLPGQIIEITVKAGDSVLSGDIVCKMEAMKMMNDVQSPFTGVVKEILVEEMQNVLENQPLMIIE